MKPISIQNYEAWLLCFVDGELDEAGRQSVLAFLEAHPELRRELRLLEAARLEPAEESFGDKAVLYRHAAPASAAPVKVIFRRHFWIPAAAAAVAAVVVLSLLWYRQRYAPASGLAVRTAPAQQPVAPAAPLPARSAAGEHDSGSSQPPATPLPGSAAARKAVTAVARPETASAPQAASSEPASGRRAVPPEQQPASSVEKTVRTADKKTLPELKPETGSLPAAAPQQVPPLVAMRETPASPGPEQITDRPTRPPGQEQVAAAPSAEEAVAPAPTASGLQEDTRGLTARAQELTDAAPEKIATLKAKLDQRVADGFAGIQKDISRLKKKSIRIGNLEIAFNH
ncbi:hypothetical protein [Compostibacter hankyongensis]|uniref:Uncharacterized protein n=1 Tax=Compostibacter hankyongensis TaxID=1007089 RepID=A0ABP8G5A8_9BACT